MSVISEIKSHFESIESRHFWIQERLDQAARLANQHRYQADEIAEVLSANTDPGDEWGPRTNNNLPVKYARFSVNWISQLADGRKWLVEIGLDKNHAWYVRQEAFLCIAHIKPVEVSEDDWNNIINLATAEGTLGIANEIRSAALKALVDNQIHAALPILQNLYDQSNEISNDDYDWVECMRNLTMACAALGSNFLIPTVIEHLFDGSWYKRDAAVETMELIAKRLAGVENIARELLAQAKLDSQSGDPWHSLKDHLNPAVVRWSLIHAPSETNEQAKELVELLGNDDYGIRTEASNELAKVLPAIKESVIKLLNATFLEPSNTRLQRTWCAFTLSRLGQEIDSIFPVEQRVEMKELWQTPWPFEIDPLIRNAIVRAHGGHPGEIGTDVRYHLEHKLTSGHTAEQATADRNQLIDALQTAGVTITSTEDCGTHHQQGGGTFWVLGLGKEANSNELYVSELGKFICYVDVYRSSNGTSSHKNVNIGPKTKAIKDPAQVVEQDVCKKIAAELGFTFLDHECLQFKVPGLNVYFFGHREPLPIQDLLFYWQD